MESPPPSLSIESFSHSWLLNSNPSSEKTLDYKHYSSFDASDEANSFIEMDPKLPPSRRFSRSVPKDFSFDFRTSHLTIADAGELISDGILVPLFHWELKASYEDDVAVSSPRVIMSSSSSSKEVVTRSTSCRVRCASLRRCKRLSKRVFQKYLDFLRPICEKLRRHGSGSRVASISISSTRGYEIDEDEEEGGGRGKINGGELLYSPAASPRASVALSVDNWRRSCDSESSIYEAVLHCKRTNNSK